MAPQLQPAAAPPPGSLSLPDSPLPSVHAVWPFTPPASRGPSSPELHPRLSPGVFLASHGPFPCVPPVRRPSPVHRCWHAYPSQFPSALARPWPPHLLVGLHPSLLSTAAPSWLSSWPAAPPACAQGFELGISGWVLTFLRNPGPHLLT